MEKKKKNSKHYIIPASYFKKKGIPAIKVSLPEESVTVADENIVEEPISPNIEVENSAVQVSQTEVAEKIVTERPKIILNRQSKSTSGLSLSSIKKKKEHLIKQMDVILEEDDLPKESFTEAQMQSVWNAYVKKIEDQGKYNLSSILSIDTPKLSETTIKLEFPNETNKIEVERQQYDLLGFLRQKLQNFDINLSITVNDELEKKYAYTDMEKFEKLKEKNPNIDVLRQTFDLDI